MKHHMMMILVICLGLSILTGCSVPEITIRPGNTQEQEENLEGLENDADEGFEGFVDTSNDFFQYMKPSEEEMAEIEVLSGADFDTISMEALQGYWYCDEGYGYEIFVEVTGEVATIRETLDGVPLDIWYGTGPATISQPGENGWLNPGLDIRTEDGDSIALIVLRRVGNGYFTTANSGVYYKVDEK